MLAILVGQGHVLDELGPFAAVLRHAVQAGEVAAVAEAELHVLQVFKGNFTRFRIEFLKKPIVPVHLVVILTRSGQASIFKVDAHPAMVFRKSSAVETFAQISKTFAVKNIGRQFGEGLIVHGHPVTGANHSAIIELVVYGVESPGTFLKHLIRDQVIVDPRDGFRADSDVHDENDAIGLK